MRSSSRAVAEGLLATIEAAKRAELGTFEGCPRELRGARGEGVTSRCDCRPGARFISDQEASPRGAIRRRCRSGAIRRGLPPGATCAGRATDAVLRRPSDDLSAAKSESMAVLARTFYRPSAVVERGSQGPTRCW